MPTRPEVPPSPTAPAASWRRAPGSPTVDPTAPLAGARRLTVGTDDDVRRLMALARHRLDDPFLRSRLDALCRRVAVELDRPMTLVTVLADTAEIVLGSYGATGVFEAHGGVPVEWSLCLHAPRRGAPYEIVDTLDEAAFGDNPLVLVDGIRSYAAVPLLTLEALPVGVLAVLDHRAGSLDRRGLAVLVDGAHEAAAVLAGARRGF